MKPAPEGEGKSMEVVMQNQVLTPFSPICLLYHARCSRVGAVLPGGQVGHQPRPQELHGALSCLLARVACADRCWRGV